jgi:hypothetical protein
LVSGFPVYPVLRRKSQDSRLKTQNGVGVFFLHLLLLSSPTFAQFYNLPNDYSFSLLTERKLAEKDSSIHSGTKPYIQFFSQKYNHVADSHRIFKYIKDDPALDLLFFKHFIRIEPKQANFKLRLDPILNFEQGRATDNIARRLGTSTRGFIGSGSIGNNVYFESLFAENQSSFPYYLDSNIRATQVVPGQGRWKGFKSDGFDYAFSSGFISIQASKRLNLQVGHGKHKMGYGYRSLLLSDNTFNYPYARITQQWLKGRLQYTNIYAVLMNLVPAAAKQNPNVERLFQKKAASFQYLSFNPAKFLNLGLFQGMIWQAGDDRNRQHLDAYYFNPLLFTNLIPYGLNNKNNILVGADIKIKITNCFDVYGQLMADDLSNTQKTGNCWGFQGGLHYFDAFGIRNLFLQGEFNHTSQGSYSSPLTAASNQSYSHYNQNLAFTPGNGSELVLITDYKWKRFFTTLRYNYQDVPQFTGTSYKLNFLSGRIGYLINPAYNLNVSLGVNYRMQNFYTFNAWNNETAYIYVGVKTSLYNLYYDF